MSTSPSTLKVSAPTVDEAIAKGLKQLGLTQDTVEVNIVDAGSRGIFGIGSREAIVQLTARQPVDAGEEPASETLAEPEPDSVDETARVEPPAEESISSAPAAVEETQSPDPEPAEPDAEEDYILTISRDSVQELLDKMRVKTSVTARYKKRDEHRRRPTVLVEVSGDDLSILIGRHAETINALQMISRLIVGKELGRSVSLQVDVQGYRKRRDRQLRRLARKMADQAVRTGRTQTLEPMPADERRITHIELRNHPKVFTESV
ncbi:MAG: RNA-binding cell elongation regulator Jag/EloR, partial [Anaerolineales bacterium]